METADYCPRFGVWLAVTWSMKISVRIVDLYGGRVWMFEGTVRQVEAALLMLFPWLRGGDRGDFDGLLEDLGSQQTFVVGVTPRPRSNPGPSS